MLTNLPAAPLSFFAKAPKDGAGSCVQLGEMRMEPDDEALARGAAAGDAAAFDALLSRHYARIFRVAWRVLGDRTEAEDVAQDVCVALPGRLGSFEGRSRFTTWLTRLVMNAARDRLRRLAARTRAGEGWGEVEALRRDEAAAAREAMDWLQGAMATLDADQRETVALVLGEEMSHAEAAEVLGVKEGTISWRMSEIRKRLRRLAEEEVA